MRRPVWAAILATSITSLSLIIAPAYADEFDPAPTGDIDPVAAAAYDAADGGKHIRVNVLTETRADLAAATQAGEVLHTFTKAPVTTLRVDTAGLNALSATLGVVSVVEDLPAPPSLDSTTTLVGADKTFANGNDGTGSTIAIIDSGVAAKHPFLAGRVTDQVCFSTTDTAYGSTSLCPDGTDAQIGEGAADVEIGPCATMGSACSHGTHVAGIAAGNGDGITAAPKRGVAPGAKIIAIQAFSRFDSTTYCGASTPCVLSFASDQLAALEQVNAYQDAGRKIIAANMSLGSGRYTAPCEADLRAAIINTLYDKGVAVVAAAGNQGAAAVNSPACVSKAVAVGALTDEDQLASYTNRGPMLDVFAPGHGVVSSLPGNTYGSKNGTSMATPHVAGALAVLRQANATAPLGDLIKALTTTGKPVTYTEATTPRVQLDAAASALAGDPKPRPTKVWDDSDATVPASGQGSVTRSLVSTVPGSVPDRLAVDFDITGVAWDSVNVDLIDPNGKVYEVDRGATSQTYEDEYKSSMMPSGPMAFGFYVNAAGSPASGEWKLRLSNGYGTFQGTLLNWSLDFPHSRLLKTDIADHSTMSSTVNVADETGNASTVTQVTLSITHPKIGDLAIDLIGPTGKTYPLKAADPNDTYPGGLAKTYSVNASDSPANGDWTLKVTDTITGNTGNIWHWMLKFPTYEVRTTHAIPDGGSTTSDFYVWDGAGDSPAKATVWAEVEHQNLAEAKLELISPDGTAYPLTATTPTIGSTQKKRYTVDIIPAKMSKPWKLRVTDTTANGSTGSLKGWTLTF